MFFFLLGEVGGGNINFALFETLKKMLVSCCCGGGEGGMKWASGAVLFVVCSLSPIFACPGFAPHQQPR